MKPIIYITDPKVLAIPIVECHEPLVDIKHHPELQYGPTPECEASADNYTKMRKSVFEKLCQAQQDLPAGWRFRVYEGFRSIAVQQMLFNAIYQQVVARYPQADHQQRFIETTRLVSPVINLDGSVNTPVHNTGAAVDIEIITEDGQLVDMGMTAKDWMDVEPDLCLTDCDLITDEVKQHRHILLDVMQRHGFVNYPTEWWHFSYGDRYWAYHTAATQAIYGSADALA